MICIALLLKIQNYTISANYTNLFLDMDANDKKMSGSGVRNRSMFNEDIYQILTFTVRTPEAAVTRTIYTPLPRWLMSALEPRVCATFLPSRV